MELYSLMLVVLSLSFSVVAAKAQSASPSPAQAQSLPLITSSVPKPRLNGEFETPVEKAYLLYAWLTKAYPDISDPQAKRPTVRLVYVLGHWESRRHPYIELALPSEAWDALSSTEKTVLENRAKYAVREAREHPEIYAQDSGASFSYEDQVHSIQGLQDDAWCVNVGHLGKDGFIIDKLVAGNSGLVARANEDQKGLSTGEDKSRDDLPVVPKRSDYKTELDYVIAVLNTRVKTVLGYQMSEKGKRVNIQLNPALWDQMLDDQRLRFCESMAELHLVSKMDLSVAYIYVDSSEIGKIGLNALGNDEFSAAEADPNRAYIR